jgi:hypothetical protein
MAARAGLMQADAANYRGDIGETGSAGARP